MSRDIWRLIAVSRIWRRPTFWGIAAIGATLAYLVVESPRAQDRAALVARGQALVTEQRCLDCHTAGVTGTPIGPDLARVAAKYREADLAIDVFDAGVFSPQFVANRRLVPPLQNALHVFFIAQARVPVRKRMLGEIVDWQGGR